MHTTMTTLELYTEIEKRVDELFPRDYYMAYRDKIYALQESVAMMARVREFFLLGEDGIKILDKKIEERDKRNEEARIMEEKQYQEREEERKKNLEAFTNQVSAPVERQKTMFQNFVDFMSGKQ